MKRVRGLPVTRKTMRLKMKISNGIKTLNTETHLTLY